MKRQSLIWALAGSCALALLASVCLADEKTPEKSNATLPTAKPVAVKIGLYVLSLYDINTDVGSFNADVWLWFNVPGKGKVKPLSSRELLNAKDYKTLISDSETKNGVAWHAEKIRGTFLHDFDMSNFPFDRHELKIVVEESLKDVSEFTYLPDLQDSLVDPAMSLEGWRIGRLSLEVKDHVYKSNFGDPSGGVGSAFSQLVATIVLERNLFELFVKVTMGLYVAIAITLMAFLMKTDSDDVFSGRMGILVGMLFATIINQQTSESTIGKSSVPTLVDRLHVAGFVCIFVGIILTLVSRWLSESGHAALAVRIDRIAVVAVGLVFIAVNLLMLHSARPMRIFQ